MDTARIGPSLASAGQTAGGSGICGFSRFSGSGLIEGGDIGLENPGELLLMQDEQMIEALTTHTPQKALAVRVGTRSVIRRLQHFDV